MSINTLTKIEKAISIPMVGICGALTVVDYAAGNHIWGTFMAGCTAYWATIVWYRFIKSN